MIVDHAHDLAAFRAAVHDWLTANVPADWQQRLAGASADEVLVFQRDWMIKLGEAGLATPHWPKEYGGAVLASPIRSSSPTKAPRPMRRRSASSSSRSITFRRR